MKLLLVAATAFEVRPLAAKLPLISQESEVLSTHLFNNSTVDILVTGVGMVLTSWHLGRLFAANHYDLAINAGIAGAFSTDIKIGTVVNVTEDCISELGAEDGEDFLTIFDLGLMDPNQHPYQEGKLINGSKVKSKTVEVLKKVSGSTVNTIHQKQEDRFAGRQAKGKTERQVDVESMEGAAFLFGCLSEKIPCIQIRSVSNYVAVRDKSKWNIKLALDNLNKTLLEIIRDVSQ